MIGGKSDTHFGLDIGTTGIRVVQVQPRAGSAPTLLTYGSMPIPSAIIESEAEGDKDKVAEFIRKLLTEVNVTTDRVVAGISSTSAFSTVITIPTLSEKEMAKAIKLQADQYIPMPAEQAKIDWNILGPVNGNQTEVLLVAAPVNAVEKYSAIIARSGLHLEALETNAIAVTRSLISAPQLPTMVVDIGNSHSEVTITHNGVTRLVRSINVGGDTFLRAVMQTLNLDTDQAKQFMQKFGVTKSKLEGQVLKAMKGPLDNFIDELKKSIQYFASHNTEIKLEKVIVTGSTTALPEFPSYMANSLGMSIEIGNPWANISYPASEQDKLMNVALHFAVAAGLALRTNQ